MANKFDRIIKENFSELTIWLLKRVLGAKSVEVVPLLPRLQRTLEREADMLLLLLCSGEDGDHIANVEWQSSNDPDMPGRLLLYYGLAYHLYKLPVKSYVIYIGKAKLNMPKEIQHPSLNFQYQIIDLSDLSPQEFLSSDVPEEVILAILAGRKPIEERRSVIREVLHKLRKLLKHDQAALDRKITQLEVFGELRNVQQLIIEEEQLMAITYNLEKDIRYRQGVEKGIEKGIERGIERGIEKGIEKGIERERNQKNTAFVKSLLQEKTFTVEKIAQLANVSIDFVQQIKNN